MKRQFSSQQMSDTYYDYSATSVPEVVYVIHDRLRHGSLYGSLTSGRMLVDTACSDRFAISTLEVENSSQQ